MRTHALVAVLAVAGALALAACSNQSASPSAAQPASAQSTATATAFVRPTNPNDQAAWNKYLGHVLGQHLQGMTASRPFAYLVPAGASSAAQNARDRQLDTITGVVLRGVTPGNLLAFGGPDSKTTADLLVKAFKQASPGSMKGVIVMFIGDKADSDRVAKVVDPTSATYRFVQM